MKDIVAIDFDGTLVDTSKQIIQSFNLSFKKNNLPRVAARKIKARLGTVAEDIVRKIYPRLSKRKVKRIISDKEKLEDYSNVKLKKGTKKGLIYLKSKYDLAIVSNENHQTIVTTLNNLGINPRLFKAIVAYDDVKKGKPNPEPLKKLEHALKQKIIALIGDTETDIETARAYGTKAIIVMGTVSHERLMKSKPDAIIKDLSEISELI
tara:strand:- start:86 stop:709 length:624 start_codon:yes stop_codon:yes gene_type:complete